MKSGHIHTRWLTQSLRDEAGIILAVCISAFVMPLDITVVSLALPAINRDLNITFAEQQAILSGYSVAFTLMIVLAGKLCEQLGVRRTFNYGWLGFALSSGAIAYVMHPAWLGMFRVLQGGAGAIVLISAAATATSPLFKGQRSRNVIALFTCSIGAGTALGPFAGAVALDLLDWRWIFLVNVPLFLIVMFLSREPMPRAGRAYKREAQTRNPLTAMPTIMLLASAVCAFFLFGTDAHEHTTSLILAPLLVACLGLFLYFERKSTTPIIDWKLFRIRQFVVVQLMAVAIGVAFWATLLFLPIFLQVGGDLGAVDAAKALLPSTAPLFVFPAVGAWLAGRVDLRTFFCIGIALIALGAALMIRAIDHPFSAWYMTAQFLSGAGAGLINSELTNQSVRAVPPDFASQASSANMAVRHIAFTLGTLVIAAVISIAIHHGLRDTGAGTANMPVGIASLIATGHFEAAKTALDSIGFDQSSEVIRRLYTNAIKYALTVSALFGITGLLIAAAALTRKEKTNDGK